MMMQTCIVRSAGNSGKARCEPGWEWAPRRPMPDYDLWFVADGQGMFARNGDVFPVERGTCVLVEPGDIVRASQHPERRLTVIYLHFTIDGDDAFAARLGGRRQLDDPGAFEWMLHRALESAAAEDAPFAETEFDLWAKAALLELVKADARARAAPEASALHKQLVRKVIELIRSRMPAVPAVDELADAVGLSPRYVSRLCKQTTGYPLKALITRVRMDRAKFLIAETTMNVSQVAEAVGCSDIYHFSKQFKQVHGVSPTAYRHAFPSRPH